MMFESRIFLQHKEPMKKKSARSYSGIAQYTNLFETSAPPPAVPIETPAGRKEKMRERLAKLNQEKNDMLITDWNPSDNPKATEFFYKIFIIYYILLVFYFVNLFLFHCHHESTKKSNNNII
jgi:hypothetical protein